MNEITKVNNRRYLGIVELRNDTLLLLEARSISPAKREETGLFEPQRMMGVFGALVSNDRAAEWVEGGIKRVNLALGLREEAIYLQRTNHSLRSVLPSALQ